MCSRTIGQCTADITNACFETWTCNGVDTQPPGTGCTPTRIHAHARTPPHTHTPESMGMIRKTYLLED